MAKENNADFWDIKIPNSIVTLEELYQVFKERFLNEIEATKEEIDADIRKLLERHDDL